MRLRSPFAMSLAALLFMPDALPSSALADTPPIVSSVSSSGGQVGIPLVIAPPAPTASIVTTAIDWLESNPGTILGGLSTLLGFLGLGVYLTTDRKRRVALAAFHAFHIVEDIRDEAEKNGKPIPTLDKAAEGLAQIDAWMRANGWRPLKTGEGLVAGMIFKSLNAQSNQAAQLAAVAPAPAPVLAASPANPQ